MDHLELLGAVERRESQVLLTALGKKMASFPLEPRYAKVKKIKRFSSCSETLKLNSIWCFSLFCFVLLNLPFTTDVTDTNLMESG